MTAIINTEIAVIGAGPGGYTAAFRTADLGRRVVLIDPRATLGGVCLNVGCIPSKALLHIAETKEAAETTPGLRFGRVEVDLPAIRNWKGTVVDRLTGGLSGLARRRKVTVIRATAHFAGPHELVLDGQEGPQTLRFEQAIIATGSTPVTLPFLPDDSRIMDSTGALALEDVPERLLILGGGIIGLEMAQVYHALGSRITVVERQAQLIPGADPELVKPLSDRLGTRYDIRLNTAVTKVEPQKDGLRVHGETGEIGSFDRILVAVGRRPNGAAVGSEAAGLRLDAHGFIPVDDQMRTTLPHVFAVGDVVGQPMLAHKAVHEAKVAAEVACGHKVAFAPRSIPSVAYTDPEIAWAGLTTTEARVRGISVKTAVFPWAASGRSLSLGRSEGLTRLVIEPESGRLLGIGITGPHAGELLAEGVLAIEMGAVAADLALTIHPHPTLSETLGLAAEAFEGTLTDL